MVTDKRNHLIDLLRILAAAFVVIFHFNEPVKYIDNWYRNFCKFGYLGVPMFFVISGYCILIALQHAKKPTEFIIRRFFRIFPPYWFSIILVCAVVLLLKIITGTNSATILPKSISGVAATICLLTTPVTKTPVINWVYWTLPYEVFFYIIVFLCSFLQKQYFTIALIAITLAGAVLPVYGSGPLFFLKYWPLFALGMSIYKLRHRPDQKWLNSCLLLVSIFGFYTTKQTSSYIIVCLFIAILLTIDHFKPFTSNRVSKYGDVSYSLYLIHVPLGIYLMGLIKARPIVQQNIALNIIIDLMLLMILIYLSGLMHRYVEIPSIKYGKKLRL